METLLGEVTLVKIGSTPFQKGICSKKKSKWATSAFLEKICLQIGFDLHESK